MISVMMIESESEIIRIAGRNSFSMRIKKNTPQERKAIRERALKISAFKKAKMNF